MSSASQYFVEKFPGGWRAPSSAFGIVLLMVFIWPHARLVIDLVIVTAIPGLIGAIVWGLTYWSRARVQIGRRHLRYKAVRRVAGIVSLACLPFLLMQRASISLRAWCETASGGSEAYPTSKIGAFASWSRSRISKETTAKGSKGDCATLWPASTHA